MDKFEDIIGKIEKLKYIDVSQALENAEEMITLASNEGNEKYYILGRFYKGTLCIYKGNALAAVDILTDVIEGLMKNSLHKQAVAAYNSLGVAYAALGDDNRAIELYLKAKDLLNIYPNIETEAKVSNNIGDLYMQIGKLDKAKMYFIDSNELDKMEDYNLVRGTALSNLGVLYYLAKDYDKSKKVIKESIDIMDRKNFTITKSNAYGSLANVYFALGDMDKAYDCFVMADEVMESTNYKLEYFGTKRDFIKLLISMNKIDEAKQGIDELYNRTVEESNDCNAIEVCNIAIMLSEHYKNELELWLERYYEHSEKNVKNEMLSIGNQIDSKIVYDKLKQANEQLKELSETDMLSHLPNKYKFNMSFSNMILECKMTQKSLGLLILDVDYFKEYNDKYGHFSGDECIRKIANTIKESLVNENYFAARLSGDEFYVVIKNKKSSEIQEYADKLRETVKNLNIEYDSSKFKKVTLSIGYVCLEYSMLTKPKDMISKAEEAVYRAKKEKDCVCEYK